MTNRTRTILAALAFAALPVVTLPAPAAAADIRVTFTNGSPNVYAYTFMFCDWSGCKADRTETGTVDAAPSKTTQGFLRKIVRIDRGWMLMVDVRNGTARAAANISSAPASGAVEVSGIYACNQPGCHVFVDGGSDFLDFNIDPDRLDWGK
ncbi:hypothetical protein [Azospirillum sp.]|uniref:hypothetical protein n=1 Tax=Azospirillum sp. TaxID=34012 RepID=UPI002D374A21|nr:hypothetical protein [Azospirillum sp.]HYD67949.1 hypothetical protein [Azospirillum sp.]